MTTNGAFTTISNHRLIVLYRRVVLLIGIFCLTSSFEKSSDREQRAKQANILIREIGHRLLLQSGDSLSRVMPVTEVREGTFQLRFEKKLQFHPDSLMALAKGLLPDTKFASGYIVTVHDCLKGGIIYGFMINYNSRDVLACKGRSQPAGCYSIEFSFPDFYGNVSLQKEVIGYSGGSVKAGGSEPSSSEVSRSGDTSGNPGQGYVSNGEESLRENNITSEDPQADKRSPVISNDSLIVGLTATMLFVGIGFLFLRSRRNRYASAGPDQVDEVIAAPDPEMPALGKYLFNVKGQYLVLASEITTLTDKECKVLELLHKSFGELISRDTLLQEVWLNEGVITGRSLDMFVSKLRKKLSGDPELGITNVHGKGYRLEIVAGERG